MVRRHRSSEICIDWEGQRRVNFEGSVEAMDMQRQTVYKYIAFKNGFFMTDDRERLSGT